MKKYVVGFLFSDDLSRVCLLQKKRPEWQAGLLNGVGGVVRGGAHPKAVMALKFTQEAGVFTSPQEWEHVCTLRFPAAEVDVVAQRNSGHCSRVRTTLDEEVGLYDFLDGKAVKEGVEFPVYENVPQLIELCRQYLNIPR